MIPAEIKSKLEEMAEDLFETRTSSEFVIFMKGAQAAWDLCQKYERERIWENIKALPVDGVIKGWLNAVFSMATTPPQSDEGAEG